MLHCSSPWRHPSPAPTRPRLQQRPSWECWEPFPDTREHPNSSSLWLQMKNVAWLAGQPIPLSRLTEGLAAAGKLGASVPAGFSLDRLTELPSKPPWCPVKGSADGLAGLKGL